MELHQLRYFVAAAEAGGISQAARACRVSQPSLSQQIKRLEASLGAELFDRLGRGVVLTEAGRAFLPRARAILQEVREAQALIEGGGDAARGRLAVGAIPTMAPYILPPILSNLRDELPGCELSVREDLTDSLIGALIDSEIDLAVMSTPVDHPLIETEVVASEALLVATAKSDAVRGETITLSELRDRPTISLHEMHCLGQQISAFCAARRLQRNIVCRTTQLSTVLGLVGLGLGVSLVPEMCARHDEGGGRRYIKVRGGPTREIALAWRMGRSRSRASLTFADLARNRPWA